MKKKSIFNLLRPRLPFAWAGKAVDSTRETAGAIRDALVITPADESWTDLDARARWQRLITETPPFISMTPMQIEQFMRRQYRHRFVYDPVFSLLAAGGGLTTLFAADIGGPQLTVLFQFAGIALSITGIANWIQNSVAAYQIRHRMLVSFAEWWSAVRKNPSEAIAKPLPRSWQLDYPKPPEPEEGEYWEEEDY